MRKIHRSWLRFAIFAIVGLIGLSIFTPFGATVHADSDDDSSNVNDFTITNFDATYHLSRDSQRRSVMQVQEKITADFPESDQNHGLERAIPTSYDGHPVFDGKLNVTRNDQPENINSTSFETGDGGQDVEVFQFGDPNEYVHGLQTYTLNYTLHDVTTTPNGQPQNFFWQVNGSAWRVPIENVSATLIIDSDFAKNVSNVSGCTVDSPNGVKITDLSTADSDCATNVSGNILRFTSSGRTIYSGESLMLGAQFKAGTFAPFQLSSTQKNNLTLLYVLLGLVIAIWLVFLVLKIVRFRSRKSKQPVVPFYSANELGANLDILQLSLIYRPNLKKVLTAIILQLATNGNLKIVQHEDQGLFKNKPNFTMELVSKTGADSLQTTVLNALFSASNSFNFDDRVRQQTVGQKLSPLFRAETASFYKTDYFLRLKPLAFTALAVILLAIGYGITGFIVTKQAIMQFANCDNLITLSIFLVPAIIISTCWVAALHPLSDAGAELRNKLLGLKMFMDVAEADRIRVLQGVPEFNHGAQTAGAEVDKNSVVKLYEKLLPFATIFGIEDSWNKVLAIQYTNGTEPGFYSGVGAFDAAYFASSMNSFSSGMSLFSASSGVSGGGGGGGAGGGGGGGGW